MTKTKRLTFLASCSLFAFCLGLSSAPASATGVQLSLDPPSHGVVAAKTPSVAVVARVVRGTQSTGRYLPKTFTYDLKVPTLKGVTAKVKKAFDKKIDAIVASDLSYYAEGALTETQYNSRLAQDANSTLGGKLVRDVPDQYATFCSEGFRQLKGSFVSSVYQRRYASVVITFSGYNAPCLSIGGLWVAYQSARSVTVDTKTGDLMSLAKFTSNAKGEVTAGVKSWYAKQSHEFLSKRPSVSRSLKACDRPGNVITVSPTQKPCYATPGAKSGLVAWLVQDKGIRLTFPAGEGPRNATLEWARIPRKL